MASVAMEKEGTNNQNSRWGEKAPRRPAPRTISELLAFNTASQRADAIAQQVALQKQVERKRIAAIMLEVSKKAAALQEKINLQKEL